MTRLTLFAALGVGLLLVACDSKSQDSSDANVNANANANANAVDGYRFVLESVTNDPTVYGTYPFSLSFTLENVGTDVPDDAHTVALVFRDDETDEEYSFDVTADPLGWTVAGSPHVVSFNESISLPDGTYEVYLNIYDPTHVGDPGYSIQFANENIWEESTGYNDLDIIVDVKASPLSVHDDVVTISSFETVGEWSGGTIDDTWYLEGTRSLRWEQSDELCTGGTCRVIFDPSEVIDISSGDLISLWVHNDVPSGDLVRTGDDYSYYGKTAEDVLQFTFVNEDNGWYGINFIRLDFTGWKRIVFSKESFVDVFDDPSVLDFIDLIWINVTDQYGTGITERTLHLDAFTVSRLPPLEVPARFLATFEMGSFDPDVGVANVFQQNEDQNDHLLVDYATVVDNPAPSAINPSRKVFMAHPAQGYVRSEYESNHFHADEKTYIYAWKEYFPRPLYDGVDPDWWGMISLGQWKAGCEEYGDGTYTDYICWGGGIFNDRRSAVGTTTMEFRFRAEPDCYLVSDVPLDHGTWVSFTTEVYWTTTNSGYYRVYRNGALVEERSGIKTMIDSFPGDNCAVISLGLGIYADWLDTGAGIIEYYLDDMAIFDVDDGVAIEDVIEWQGH